MYFRRENNSRVEIDEMFQQFQAFVRRKPEYDYKMIIGTDSKVFETRIKYVTAITLQRIGNGAIIYYHSRVNQLVELSNRIMNEVNYTIEMANQVIIPKCLQKSFLFPIEIHIDIGTRGKSGQFKNMALGYAKGCGFDERIIKIKPDAFGATNVADRYTK